MVPSTYKEWKTLATAPFMAGLLITVSDMSGPLGVVKEALTVAKAVSETAAGSSNELIKIIAEEIKTKGGKPEMPDLPQDLAGLRTALINGCKTAAALVAQKSPAEADEYKRWLATLAQKTAEAAKEGGFLGIGGTQVSDDERAALNELNSAIGLST